MSVMIITGAARGIGKATVERLIADARTRGESASLVLVDRLKESLEELAATLNRDGFQAVALVGDLSDADFCVSIPKRAKETFGRIDALISNAGMYTQAPLSELAVDDWDRVIDVNVRATWLLAQSAYPMLKASQGQIVVIGSISGINPQPGLAAYSVSKAAVMMLAGQLAVEWAKDGIRTNIIAPGTVRTPNVEIFYADPVAKAKREAVVPIGRIADPSEIAGVVAFLLGPDAAYCNGATIVVDGGLTRSLMLHVAQVTKA
jgi:NAD(P)-dependent dehydrogenase (short-subunit alcohol dehydrogenase family)